MNNNYFTFSVGAEKIRVHHFSQQESRGDTCLMLLQAIVSDREGRLGGTTGWISYLDHPPEENFIHKADLKFCTTKILGESSPFLPFPCPHALRWPQIGLEDANDLLNSLVAHSDAHVFNSIFWLGANTHPSRERLATLSEKYHGILDAELMSWDRSHSGLHQSKGRHVSLWDHRLYKYLVDCPGYGYSGRLKWLLASGRPVFVVERRCVEHWHDKLMPWVHFIPVKEDLSDLLAAFHTVEENPALYRSISLAAKRFAQDHLVLEAQLMDLIRAIDAPETVCPKLLDYDFLIDEIIRPADLVGKPGIFLEIGAFLGGGTNKLGHFLRSENVNKPLLVIDAFETELREGVVHEKAMREIDRLQLQSNPRLGQREVFERNVRGLLNVKVFRGHSCEMDFSRFLIAFAAVESGESDEDLRRNFSVVWSQLISGGIVAFHSHDGDFKKMSRTIDGCLEEISSQVREVVKLEQKWLISVKKV